MSCNQLSKFRSSLLEWTVISTSAQYLILNLFWLYIFSFHWQIKTNSSRAILVFLSLMIQLVLFLYCSRVRPILGPNHTKSCFRIIICTPYTWCISVLFYCFRKFLSNFSASVALTLCLSSFDKFQCSGPYIMVFLTVIL